MHAMVVVCVKPQCDALGVGRFCGLQPDSNGCRIQCEVTRFDFYDDFLFGM